MNIKLDLTEAEVDQILNALAQQPYIKVAKLIEGIAKVAKDQLTPPEPPP